VPDQDSTTGGLSLIGCKNVMWHGPANLTYTQDQLPYAQGTVLAVSDDQVNYAVQVSSAAVQRYCSHTCLLFWAFFTGVISQACLHSLAAQSLSV
jgi:hypothetical protein